MKLFLITVLMAWLSTGALSQAHDLSEYTFLGGLGPIESCFVDPSFKTTECSYIEYANSNELPEAICKKDLIDASTKLSADIQSKNIDVQVNCSKVITKIEISDIKSRGPQKADYVFVTTHYHIHKKIFFISRYCKPRALGDSQLMSLLITCRNQGLQSCYDPKILAALNKVQPTKFITEQSGTCRY